MPVSTYEGMFLLDSTKVAVNWDDAVQHVHDILRKHNAEIVSLDNQGTEIQASRQWDERRLAYPVEGQKKGTYLLTYFRAEGANIKEIEADCRLSDLILRDLILKVHPKLVDHLVNQAMTSTPGGEDDGPPEEDLDDRPRRRRREQD
jgi:small subunit ribosomal protein S6